MRYKVRADDDVAYNSLLSYLDGRVRLFAASPRRRMVATGDLPATVRKEIASRGGHIVEDRAYDLEQPV